ncbi:MAG TPA: diguanylate cyclase [Deltaproteobacteria bacterium]|nr:diguanylate cyclase [Deltaproteobacteria bacterium]
MLRITISLGVSQYHAGENIDELLSRADTALYQAKTNGRNQVILL